MRVHRKLHSSPTRRSSDLNGGTVTGSGAVSSGTFNLNGGTLNTALAFTSVTFNLNGGALSGSPILVNSTLNNNTAASGTFHMRSEERRVGKERRSPMAL